MCKILGLGFEDDGLFSNDLYTSEDEYHKSHLAYFRDVFMDYLSMYEDDHDILHGIEDIYNVDEDVFETCNLFKLN